MHPSTILRTLALVTAILPSTATARERTDDPRRLSPASFVRDFNQASGQVRLVMLLSPT